MASKLYTYPSSTRSFKVLISAQYSHFNIDVAKDFVLGETNKTSGFLQKFPLGKVPALEDKNGPLFESNAIAYYVANDQLRGKNTFEQAQVIQWLSFSDNEIVPSVSTWVFPILGIINFNKQSVEKGKADTLKLLNVLNDVLLTRTYLVGERITLADIVLVCSLLPAYQFVLEPSLRNSYPNVNRWFITLVNQPEFLKVLGNVKLCDKAETVPKKGSESSGKKEKTPKKEEKKEEKQKEKKVSEVADDAEEEEFAEPKAKNPFDLLPKGTFNMDDFKRFYSNNPEDKSIAYFWEKFDKENYSIWFCEYKYPDELTQIFMSCNLISGMFQRLDSMRKNAFGSVILFGEDNKSSISGIWVWRGHDLAFTLSPDWQVDYESYDWKKLNPDEPETKTLVNEYLSWSGNFNGKKFNQGKIFK